MQQNSTLTNNVLWFLAALGLAFFVWLVATTQANPIVQKSFSNIPVQFTPDAGLIVTERNPSNAVVTVRAQQSVMDSLTNFDITVHARLAGLGPGTHIVPLEANVAESRRAAADTRPAQVTVTLEQEKREQKLVEARFLSDPPIGFIVGDVTLSETQVLVTGVASRVEQVDHLEAQIDLSDRRTTFNEEIVLVAIDANGTRISDVTVAQPVRVTVEITQDEEVELVFVTPNINRTSLPSSYVYLGVVDYNPKTISVTGEEEALSALPDTLQTELIDLSSQSGTFTTSVGIRLPEGVFLAEPGQTIEVTIGIEPREDVKQLDDIPVQIRSSNPDQTEQVVPDVVTVLVRGPQPIVRQLTADNIRVEVNVQGLAPGNYDLEPTATVNIGQIDPDSISVLPGRITVSIESIDSTVGTLEALPESTAEN